jgi:type I restriction enzyme R subunit
MIREQQIEQSLIDTLCDLKYRYRQDIRNQDALERNFREQMEMSY